MRQNRTQANSLRTRISKRLTRSRLSLERLETRSLMTTNVGLCGDVNLDGSVNFDDFLILSENYGTEGDRSQGDFTGDGRVEFEDFLVVSENFGASIGAASRLGPEKVIEAAGLINEGQIYSLAHILENDSPGNPFVSHVLELDMVLGPFGENETVALVETLRSNFMHVGTQFDALGHIGIGDMYFNGNTFDEVFSPTGLHQLGVEDVPPFFTRGVLLDVAAYKGVDILPPTYEITVDDLNGTLELQNSEIHSGDIVLFHTGWGSHYVPNNEIFGASSPGIGIEAAQELARKEVVMVGADNWAVEVVPNPDPNLAFPVHQELLARHGIYLMEIAKTDEIARDRIYEFAFAFAPIRVAGATGSAAHPFIIT